MEFSKEENETANKLQRSNNNIKKIIKLKSNLRNAKSANAQSGKLKNYFQLKYKLINLIH